VTIKSPLSILAMMQAFALTDLGLPQPSGKEEPPAPPKKCLLEGCDKPREGNKSFCCKEHFGEYQKQRRAKG